MSAGLLTRVLGAVALAAALAAPARAQDALDLAARAYSEQTGQSLPDAARSKVFRTWQAFADQGLARTDASAPRGALVFYEPQYGGPGRLAVSAGDGKVLVAGTKDPVAIDAIPGRLGWVDGPKKVDATSATKTADDTGLTPPPAPGAPQAPAAQGPAAQGPAAQAPAAQAPAAQAPAAQAPAAQTPAATQPAASQQPVASSAPAPVAHPAPGKGAAPDAPATGFGGSGEVFVARGTGYYPANNAMEGGFKDRKGKKLSTLQDFLNGNSPFVSVAMDSKAFPYGTKLRIQELEAKYGRQIEFRVVDTGGAFKGKGKTRIDICTANSKASHDATINGTLHCEVIR